MRSEKPIRRSQLIAPFGVGALVDFRGDESLMTAGLDVWPSAKQTCPTDLIVNEDRMQVMLGVDHFRLPPEVSESNYGNIDSSRCIPFLRFPRWHYCPIRGAMKKLEFFGVRERCPCPSNIKCNMPRSKRPWLIPSRFIAICPAGHIEDFPFMEWVHRTQDFDNTHILNLRLGQSSAGLSGIRIQCSCGQARSMTKVFNFDSDGGALSQIGVNCSGQRPWFGSQGQERDCREPLRVVQRGASNVYFPATVSSIYLPGWDEDIAPTIKNLLNNQEIWNYLISETNDGKFIRLDRCETMVIGKGIDAIELQEGAQRKLNYSRNQQIAGEQTEVDYRFQEYQALLTERKEKPHAELIVEVHDSSTYGTSFTENFSQISLIKKLRETRILRGFSRLIPPNGSSDENLQPIALNSDIRWLPATVVHGEGIFIEFNSYKLNKWRSQHPVEKRINLLSVQHNRKRRERGLVEEKVTPKFVLLHTFAHLLIRQLSFDCGYGTASLRERIYCEKSNSSARMQGVLIYTASGDSEGTLGGLVRQGEVNRLTAILERSIDQASWCSSDPICIESRGQGTDSTNLAACHSCTLLSETSCEFGNRLLDRGLIVGTQEYPEIGFFSGMK